MFHCYIWRVGGWHLSQTYLNISSIWRIIPNRTERKWLNPKLRWLCSRLWVAQKWGNPETFVSIKHSYSSISNFHLKLLILAVDLIVGNRASPNSAWNLPFWCFLFKQTAYQHFLNPDLYWFVASMTDKLTLSKLNKHTCVFPAVGEGVESLDSPRWVTSWSLLHWTTNFA